MPSSFDLRDRLGSGWHWEWGGSEPQWVDRHDIWAAYKLAGLRHMRCSIQPPGSPKAYLNDWMDELAADGALFTILLAYWNDPDPRITLQIDEIAERFADATVAIEALNEPAKNEIDHVEAQRHIGRTGHRIRSIPALDNIPYVGPSCTSAAEADAIDDQSCVLDTINAHLYSGNKVQLGSWVDTYGRLQNDGYLPGSSLLWATEFGVQYGVSPAWPDITEREGAIILTKQILTQYRKGVIRQFVYDFYESGNNMGLLRADRTPRPAYVSIAKLMSLLDDHPVAPLPPLAFTITGAPGDLQTLVLDCADGKQLLFLWREAPLGVANANITLALPGKSHKISYDLIDATPDCDNQLPAGPFALQIADNPLVYRI